MLPFFGHTTSSCVIVLKCVLGFIIEQISCVVGSVGMLSHDVGLWQVSELEKRESRLKEVFKTQVSNFREACFCLFGYRVDMASQVRFLCTTALLLEETWPGISLSPMYYMWLAP